MPVLYGAVRAYKGLTTVITYSHLFTESVDVTLPLKDQQIKEGDDVTLECTVTKPDLTAEWTKDGSLIEPSEKIIPKSADKTHSLLIKNVEIDDAAEYIVKVGDVTSKSKLEVQG